MHRVLGYRATLAGVAVAVVLYLAEVLLAWDTSEWLAYAHARLEPFDLDELVLGLICVAVGAVIDLNTRRQRWRTEAELREVRLQTLRATVHTAQDIVNNALTGLQLFRMKAQQSGALDAEALALFDALVAKTAENLSRLGNVKEVSEGRMSDGERFIDYRERP